MTGCGSRAETAAEGAQGRLALRALGSSELAWLRGEALRLLETCGVVVSGELARAALAAAGVPLEQAQRLTRLPAGLIDETLALAPKTPVLGGRAPECDVVLGRTALLATGGPAAELLSAGGEGRPAQRRDLADACRLADALPEVAVVAGPPLALARSGAAADVPLVPRQTRRVVAEELEACLANTTKHVMLTTTIESPAQAEAVAAMAAAVAGDDEALRGRPPVSLVAPGLHAAGSAVDALLVAARRGLPVGFALALGEPSAAAGGALATTPGEALAEAAGLGKRLARQAASALAACAVVQLVAPGTTFIASPAEDALWPPPADLADAPRAWLLALAYNELVSSFGLPSLIASATAGAAHPGWRSSVETTFATLITALGIPALLMGAGLLAGGPAFSPGQLMDCESRAVCARIAEGIEVDEETMALETIAAVGIGGNALAQRHTRRHMRDVWRPRVFDRSSLEAWQREGRVGSERKAEELAARILAEHRVPPLEAEKAETLARIIATSGL